MSSVEAFAPQDAKSIVHGYIKHRARLLEAFVNTIYPDFSCAITLDHRARNRDWGGTRKGVPFISLGTAKYIRNIDRPMSMREYPAFASSPHIGSMYGVSWQQCADAVIAHEMAHAVLHSLVHFNDRHGPVWQALYWTLRAWLLAQPR